MFIGRQNVTLAAVIPTPLRGQDCDEIWIVIMILKNLYLIAKCRYWFNLLAHDNENHMLMLINCWILDHVCNFSNKISCWFKYICINMWACKISARFHCLTEMSPDRNGPDGNNSDRIGNIKKSCTCIAQHLIAPYKDNTAYLHIA